MINLIISGHVGSDATVANNGAARFSIAVTKKGYTTKDGRVVEDKTRWFTVFKSNGENLAQYIKKGNYISVSAEDIVCSVHEGKASMQINAREISLAGNKSSASTSASVPNNPDTSNDGSDEVPF